MFVTGPCAIVAAVAMARPQHDRRRPDLTLVSTRTPVRLFAGGVLSALLLSACVQGPIGGTAGVTDHCVAALGRLVRQGDAVEVWGKKVASKTVAGRTARVVDMEVTIAGDRMNMQCVYPTAGALNASSIRLGNRQLTQAQLAAVNTAVRDNQDIGAQVRKRIPSPPDVGPFTFSPDTRRKKN